MKELESRPFVLIGVHLKYENDEARTVREVMTKELLGWRTFVDDGSIAAKWKPPSTPSFFLIDAHGVIRRKWGGAPGEKTLHAAVLKLVGETEAAAKK